MSEFSRVWHQSFTHNEKNSPGGVMDRTVPKTGSEEIELYMRTYYSLLRSTHTIQIETLVETHMAIESSLHVNARNPYPDASALTYRDRKSTRLNSSH